MNLFKKLRTWHNKRKTQRKSERQFDGFSWALGAFFDRRYTIEELNAMTYCNHSHDFDIGIERAICLIEGLELEPLGGDDNAQ